MSETTALLRYSEALWSVPNSCPIPPFCRNQFAWFLLHPFRVHRVGVSKTGGGAQKTRSAPGYSMWRLRRLETVVPRCH